MSVIKHISQKPLQFGERMVENNKSDFIRQTLGIIKKL